MVVQILSPFDFVLPFPVRCTRLVLFCWHISVRVRPADHSNTASLSLEKYLEALNWGIFVKNNGQLLVFVKIVALT